MSPTVIDVPTEAAEATDGPVTASEPSAGPETRSVPADAPYGRTASGAPKGKPGRKPRTAKASTAAPPPRKAATGRRAAPPRPDYRKGLGGFVQIASAPLVVLSRKSDAAAADLAALAVHSGPIIEAVNDLAAEDPRLAAALDRLMSIGPYGALLAALVPFGVQLAVNHGAVPLDVGKGMGAEDPAALAASVRRAPRMADTP